MGAGGRDVGLGFAWVGVGPPVGLAAGVSVGGTGVGVVTTVAVGDWVVSVVGLSVLAVAVIAGRGVFVGVGVATGPEGPQDARATPNTMTAVINSHGQVVRNLKRV